MPSPTVCTATAAISIASEKEVDTVAAFPDFNPRHFLDTAEMTHALAIAYDWLFDTWTDSQRATIRNAIVEMGLKPGLAVYHRGGWSKSVHNWNQVCNGGLTVGALAIGDEQPELAGQIVHNAIKSIPRAMASYAPDGAWAEGPGYWSYATSYNVLMLAALQSALGSEFGLAEMPGFSQTGLFPIYMTSPINQTFNFADSGSSVGSPMCLFWLARRFDLPVCDWFAVHHVRPSARAIIWYQKPTVDPVQAGLPTDKYYRHVEAVTMRSAWNDPQALFVGMQAGSNRVNHNHLDLGTFVLDALGQRWATDLGGDNYNLPGYFGRNRYEYYRLRAEGHNTLLINPGATPDQEPQADAKIARFQSGPNRTIAIADLTSAYASHAKRVERGLAMLDRRAVLLQDEIEAAQPVTVWWFMHTRAQATLSDDGRTVTLTRKDKKLTARLLAPADAKFEVRPAEPLPDSPHPAKQADNKGVQKLTVHLPGVSNLRLAVLFQPLTDNADTTQPPEIKPLAQW